VQLRSELAIRAARLQARAKGRVQGLRQAIDLLIYRDAVRCFGVSICLQYSVPIV